MSVSALRGAPSPSDWQPSPARSSSPETAPVASSRSCYPRSESPSHAPGRSRNTSSDTPSCTASPTHRRTLACTSSSYLLLFRENTRSQFALCRRIRNHSHPTLPPHFQGEGGRGKRGPRTKSGAALWGLGEVARKSSPPLPYLCRNSCRLAHDWRSIPAQSAHNGSYVHD